MMSQIYLIIDKQGKLVLQTKDPDALRTAPRRFKAVKAKSDLEALGTDTLVRLYKQVSGATINHIPERGMLIARFWKFLKPR